MSDRRTEAPTRRSFLDILLALGGLGTLASIFYPVLRYLKPLPSAGPGGPLRLSSDQAAKLEHDRMLIVRAGTERVIVFLDRDEKLRALSARCTHEGCTVKWVPSDAVIWCACHNGRFAADGRVLAGPPPRPLPRFSAQRDTDGTIVVTTEVQA